KNDSRSLSIEFDYSSNPFRAAGYSYQLFIRLTSHEVNRHVPFHYCNWQDVSGEHKMSILTIIHHYFDLQQYHNIEHWDGIKLGIQAECTNLYKDRKTKLTRHFDKEVGYEDTKREKNNSPKGIDPESWVRVIDELFTTSTFKNRSL
ncbi:hypothetical protein R6Q57_022596, partial [Mikania cordata]